MKTRKKELDVDYIGGAGPLTKEEERKISDIIKGHRTKLKVVSQRLKRKLTATKKESV